LGAAERDQHVPHLNQLIWLDVDLLYGSRSGRRDIDSGLVRLDGQHLLPLLHLIAFRDENVHDLGLVNALSQIRELELLRHAVLLSL
jgi:hypothetical protein